MMDISFYHSIISSLNMDSDEHIQAHILSVWKEAKKLFSLHGTEGMLILTDKHLMFVNKTEAKVRWWNAATQRQVLTFLKLNDVMIHQDGYDEEQLRVDLKKQKYQFSVVQDWVKYPVKAPTKYMKVGWSAFIQYIKDRQKITN